MQILWQDTDDSHYFIQVSAVLCIHTTSTVLKYETFPFQPQEIKQLSTLSLASFFHFQANPNHDLAALISLKGLQKQRLRIQINL